MWSKAKERALRVGDYVFSNVGWWLFELGGACQYRADEIYCERVGPQAIYEAYVARYGDPRDRD